MGHAWSRRFSSNQHLHAMCSLIRPPSRNSSEALPWDFWLVNTSVHGNWQFSRAIERNANALWIILLVHTTSWHNSILLCRRNAWNPWLYRSIFLSNHSPWIFYFDKTARAFRGTIIQFDNHFSSSLVTLKWLGRIGSSANWSIWVGFQALISTLKVTDVI